MTLTVNISPGLEQALREQWSDLDRAAKEALLIEAYRTGRVSLGLLAQELGMGVLEADRWLADRRVAIPMTVEEWRQELTAPGL